MTNIDNYIQMWRRQLIKENADLNYCNESSNSDFARRFKELGEKPIIAKDNDGNPIYMTYDEKRNVLQATVNGENVEYTCTGSNFGDNLNNFEEKVTEILDKSKPSKPDTATPDTDAEDDEISDEETTDDPEKDVDELGQNSDDTSDDPFGFEKDDKYVFVQYYSRSADKESDFILNRYPSKAEAISFIAQKINLLSVKGIKKEDFKKVNILENNHEISKKFLETDPNACALVCEKVYSLDKMSNHGNQYEYKKGDDIKSAAEWGDEIFGNNETEKSKQRQKTLSNRQKFIRGVESGEITGYEKLIKKTKPKGRTEYHIFIVYEAKDTLNFDGSVKVTNAVAKDESPDDDTFDMSDDVSKDEYEKEVRQDNQEDDEPSIDDELDF